MFDKEPDLYKRTKRGTTLFWPTPRPRGHLEWKLYSKKGHLLSAEDQALQDFMLLITNPKWYLLGGPCNRCGDYYLKKTQRQKAYCSKTCGAAATAIPATRKKRQEDHARKIAVAQKFIDQWGERKRRTPWKKWVSDETRLNVRWISRAVNRGQLVLPRER